MSIEVAVGDLAERIGATVFRGDPTTKVRRVMPTDAADKDAITFVSKAKYVAALAESSAAAVMLTKEMAEAQASCIAESVVILVVARPYVAFARAAQALAGKIPAPEGWHAASVIEAGAEVSRDASLGPFVFVGAGAVVEAGAVLYPGVHVHAGARVGAGTVLYDHVVVRHGCRVGARCILHPGVVVGADGFGFAPEPNADGVEHIKIPQLGDVEIEDDVEIGANSCVDRGALGTTRIGKGSKIDNLVQIGHNADIGDSAILVAQCGVAGSATLGKQVTMGAQSGVSGHLKIGAGSLIYGQAGVKDNLPASSTVVGTPAVSQREFFKAAVRVRKLGRLADRVKALESRVGPVEEK